MQNLSSSIVNRKEYDSLKEEADLYKARLDGAYLIEAHLENTDLSRAHLEGVELENVFLADIRRIGPRIVDAHWDGTNLAVVEMKHLSTIR